ncbi:MAG: sigma-70 family RNA polymerase sigma factor [Thermoflexales bacterium]|nr:sigma-70 family RNA polymerase sigma factor [Thermoflexales bacterium]
MTDHSMCRQIVRKLVEKYDWALLPEDELADMVQGLIQAEACPDETERLARRCYAETLYQACHQDLDAQRRERGYYELYRYLLRAAYNRRPDIAQDVTQRALVLVCEQIDRCRDPGAFFAFATYKLLHAIQQEQRTRDSDRAEEWPDNCDELEDPVGLEAFLDHQESLGMLVDAIGRLPDHRQQKVIVFRFLEGASDSEIGAQLGITDGHVRALRSRGVAQLQTDKLLRDFYEL